MHMHIYTYSFIYIGLFYQVCENFKLTPLHRAAIGWHKDIAEILVYKNICIYSFICSFILAPCV